MLSDQLRDALLAKGLPEESLEKITELNFTQYRRLMVELADKHYSAYKETIDTLNKVADYTSTHYVVYYYSSSGIGYIILDEKQFGFHHDH